MRVHTHAHTHTLPCSQWTRVPGKIPGCLDSSNKIRNLHSCVKTSNTEMWGPHQGQAKCPDWSHRVFGLPAPLPGHEGCLGILRLTSCSGSCRNVWFHKQLLQLRHGPKGETDLVLCCALLQRRVQLFVTLRTVACQAPLSMGILQQEYLEWVAMPSSRGSSQPRDQTQVSCLADGFFTFLATREAQQILAHSIPTAALHCGETEAPRDTEFPCL